MKSTSIVDPNEEELERIQQTYELLEPLVEGYLTDHEKRAHAEAVRQRLRISPRTLRLYLSLFVYKNSRRAKQAP